MIAGGLACVVHGLLPFLFTTTGSRTISTLYERMIRNRTPATHPGGVERAGRQTRQLMTTSMLARGTLADTGQPQRPRPAASALIQWPVPRRAGQPRIVNRGWLVGVARLTSPFCQHDLVFLTAPRDPDVLAGCWVGSKRAPISSIIRH